ncbi:hypothetical protein Bca4012_020529 [Brassica carinata]
MVVAFCLLMEVEKAKNSIDLNKGPGDESGDHIVPTYTPPDTNKDMIPYATAVNLITGYGMAGESAFYQRLMECQMDSSMDGAGGGGYEAPDGRKYYAPTRPVFHGGAAYWDDLMASRYATELNMIYGVAGSENVGYPSTDLVIGSSENTYQHQLMRATTGPPTFLSNGGTCVNAGMVNNKLGAFGGGMMGDGTWEKWVGPYTGDSQACLSESNGGTSGVGSTRQ